MKIFLVVYLASLTSFSIHGMTAALNLGSQSHPYLPTPSARAGYDTKAIFKRSLTGWNSEFSFS